MPRYRIEGKRDSDMHRLLKMMEQRGDFRDKKITIIDPDDLTGKTKQIYEDMDFEDGNTERQCILTLYPEHTIGARKGDYCCAIFQMSHKKAFADIRKMIEQGWRIQNIERDLVIDRERAGKE